VTNVKILVAVRLGFRLCQCNLGKYSYGRFGLLMFIIVSVLCSRLVRGYYVCHWWQISHTVVVTDVLSRIVKFTAIGFRLRLKCDGTRSESRFRLSAKRTSPIKSAGASVQSTTGSRGVRISGSNVGYTMSRGSVKGTGYPLQSTVSPSLPLPCVTVCHHFSSELNYTVTFFLLHYTF